MGKILIVDDALFMRKMLGDMLVKLGYTVVGEAGNGEEAISQYKKLNPDLVMMDITMPVMDGLKGLDGIKQYDASAKVVMCSAMGQQAMVIDAIRLGAVDFVVKPINEERISLAVKKVLGY